MCKFQSKNPRENDEMLILCKLLTNEHKIWAYLSSRLVSF